jgi:hypothetical protein
MPKPPGHCPHCLASLPPLGRPILSQPELGKMGRSSLKLGRGCGGWGGARRRWERKKALVQSDVGADVENGEAGD